MGGLPILCQKRNDTIPSRHHSFDANKILQQICNA